MKDLGIQQLPELWKEESKSSLLFKPAGQMALIQGLGIATQDGRLSLNEAVQRSDKVDWCMKSDVWEDIIVRPNGTIDPGKDARRSAAYLIAYLISEDKMPETEKKTIHDMYNR